MTVTDTADGDMLNLWVGTFSKTNDRTLHVFGYDPSSGALNHVGSPETVINPSFLVAHPSGDFLYAVSEIFSPDPAQPVGEITAFAIDSEGLPTLLNQQPATGARPCHISIDGKARVLFAANYRGEGFGMFPIRPDGTVGPAAAAHRHRGSGVDPKRQLGPHPHACIVHPSNKWLYVADLGTDQVMIYDLDADGPEIRPHDPTGVALPPGSGPRHLKFHPHAPFAYVTNEMGGSVSVLACDADSGNLRVVETVSTLPEGYAGVRWNSEIALTPCGRFLYAANRGHDSIAAFAIHPESGKPTLIEHLPSHGKTPRHFTFDPSGSRLLVGNQDSGSISVFDVDPGSGRLGFGRLIEDVKNPACLVFRPGKRTP